MSLNRQSSQPVQREDRNNEDHNVRDRNVREDFSDYVAHLQLHMGLHSRRLTRPLVYGGDSCDQLLQQTLADLEKQASRQV